MRSRVRLLALTVALVAFLPVAALAQEAPNGNGYGIDNGNGGGGNGGGNNGNGNGNGGPRPTPGLDAAMITALGAAGYMGYRYLQLAKNKP
jgi:hypothetical protein